MTPAAAIATLYGANRIRSEIMANPVCPHCRATRFELTENEPLNANYKIFIVHCLGCGAPFGAMEHAVAGVFLAQQERTLGAIQESLSGFDQRLRAIEKILRPR